MPTITKDMIDAAQRVLIRHTVAEDEATRGAEGIVFQHSDGRFAKIKARDFRPVNV